MVTKIELSYIAGMVDGDGTINITKSIKKRKCKCKMNIKEHIYEHKYPRLRITNTDLNLLNWIKKKLNVGHIYENNRKTPSFNKKQLYSYNISKTKDVIEIIKKIYPYLIVKKKNAERILSIFT